jgi:hypothetical protein
MPSGSTAAVRYSAHVYQLSLQLELIAGVRDFDAVLSRARTTTGEASSQALSKAIELYRGPAAGRCGLRVVGDCAPQVSNPLRRGCTAIG